jgi:hypothetical protein
MRLSLGALDLSDGQRYCLDGSEIPFPDLDSMLALLPGYAQGEDAGAYRDIVLRVLRRLANKVWADTGSEQNAFVSPRYASGGLLDVWGIALQVPRLLNERDGSYRTRLLTAFVGITPNAIKSVVLGIAADFNNTKVAFQEPANDCIFAAGDDPNAQAWWGYAQPDNQLLWSSDPGNRNGTPGVFAAPETVAAFYIIIQLGAGGDGVTPFALDDNDVTTTDANCFLSDGTVDWGFAGFDGDPFESRLVAEVNARKAFGVAWALIESPYLNGAL